MHLLLIGSGGREHAMAWKLAQSADVTRVSVAPGNPGMAGEDKVDCLDMAATDIEQLATFAQSNKVHLTIVGPAAPLVAGIVQEFASRGLRIFGPRTQPAHLDGT